MTRAADDFPAIRARLEELRRERIRVAANNDPRRLTAGGPMKQSTMTGRSPTVGVSCLTSRNARRF